MARMLFATVPVIGHINPLIPLARSMVARGHEVRWYSGRKHAARIEATGAHFTGYAVARDYDDLQLEKEFPGRSELKGLDQLRFDLTRIFIDAAPGQYADISAIVREWHPEVLVADPTMFGAGIAHERLDIPLATLSVLPCVLRSRDTAPFGLGLPPVPTAAGRVRNALLNWLVEHVIFRGVQRHWQRTRALVDLEPAGFLFDAPRHISRFLLPTVPGFEYPRSDMPGNIDFIGILPVDPPSGVERPAWFDELDGSRPVVHVSQGTIANARPDLFAPAIEGLADENVLVVLATGGRQPQELGLARVPDNVRVASLLPYADLLPRTSVMVTNGGYGGVQLALSHGVPLVVAGTTEDKPEVAARVAWSGAGVNLRTSTPTPDAVRSAVRKVIAEASYREHAKRLSREFAQYDAVALGTASIEALIGAGKPRLA
ncbi:glycosyltransferase [Variovorax sp. J22R133]|uniref:glycosyltransferase n=1 Tax=Variovorax brevis TaxID=3053503 RepID=UPI002576957A|nr:nucleotide disphospho-sugar-binding domain-containing protein [Variovorax sp. J22R133]MDM0111328.1 glycosyltransferase [Variovorax sp. J22R133]